MHTIPLKKSRTLKNNLLLNLIFLFSSLFSLVQAQQAFQMRSAIDSTSVKIGSVINYAIQVEENKDKLVVFPEGDSFSPLEVIKSYKIDTLNEGGRYRLLKQYALTQFDSGHYTIPKQKVVIGDKTFFSDSLKVEFRDVVVDTSKQKLYPIKNLMAVEDLSETNWLHILYWVLGALIIVGLVLFLLWKFTGKKVSSEEELPAYDRALLALKRINSEKLIEEKKFKEYYSKLTDLAKNYLDEEITKNALESTTDELILLLQKTIKDGKLLLEKEDLEEFKHTLQTADYAKFAAINPTNEVANKDQQIIEKFIKLVANGKPALTEEELLENETYRLEQEQKKLKARKHKLILVGVSMLLWAIVLFVGVGQFPKLKDLVLNRSTNGWLKKEWIRSTYGVPGISISTPEVLTRNAVNLTPEQQQQILGTQIYTLGQITGKFFMTLSTVSFRQAPEITPEQSAEGLLQQLQQQKAEIISSENEAYETLNGTKGIKITGVLRVEIPETKQKVTANFTALAFAESGGIQHLLVMNEAKDTAAKKVMQRILKSVEINKNNN